MYIYEYGLNKVFQRHETYRYESHIVFEDTFLERGCLYGMMLRGRDEMHEAWLIEFQLETPRILI